MNRIKVLWTAVAALVLFFVLFEVSFNFEFSPAGEGRELDPEQEARYAACFNKQDKKIHEIAFGTIDNPDVQKLYISNNRDVAARDCREEFPERWIVVDEPLHFNLIDLRYRF